MKTLNTKSTQVDSSNDYSASADSMDCHAAATASARNDKNALDCHATAAAVSRNDRKPTRLGLSLACFIALSSSLTLTNLHAAWYINYGNRVAACANASLQSGQGFTFASKTDQVCQGDSISLNTPGDARGRYILLRKVNLASHYNVTATNNSSHIWTTARLDNSNITGTMNLKGLIKTEVRSESGNNTVNEINHGNVRLNLRASDGASLAVTTINQDTAGDTQIFKNVNITTFNLNNGKVYQFDGVVDTLTIRDGEYRQGLMENGNVAPDTGNNGNHGDGGEIHDLNLQGGTFVQGKGSARVDNITQSGGNLDQRDGSITTLNQSGGTATQNNGTITTANLSGGVFTHNGGTLTSITLKGGGSGSTFINGSSTAINQVTQEGGSHTINYHR